ncbi:hypothetical protein BAE44_0002744, partial [Dichanthelium oligosanthes]
MRRRPLKSRAGHAAAQTMLNPAPDFQASTSNAGHHHAPAMDVEHQARAMNVQPTTHTLQAPGLLAGIKQMHGVPDPTPAQGGDGGDAASWFEEEPGMEQVLSDLQALESLYGLLHRGPADENLDNTSRALLMKMLDDATQQALLKQAKMLSGSLMSPALERKLSIRSDRRTRDAEPRLSLRPPASPSPSLLASERSSRLNLQYSTVSSRAGGHVDGNRLAAEEPLLSRLTSYRSSRSALPPRRRPSGEQRHSGLSLHRLSVAATSQHGTVTGNNRHADQRDRTRRISGRGDQSSQEGSSRRRFMSREMSLGRARLHGRVTGRRVGEESSSLTRRFGRLDSGLSLSKMSRRGSERAGTSRHGTVTGSNRNANRRDRMGRSSSSSRGDQSSQEGSIRRHSVSPERSLGRARLHGCGNARHVEVESSYSTRRLGRLDSRLNQDHKERCLRRAEEEEESSPRRGSTDAS